MHAESTGKTTRLHRSRGFRVAFLAFQFLWLNIIVPGHHRGVVSLPGTQCPACESAAAEQPVRACCAHRNPTPPKSPADPALHCAICFFAARLSPAVAFDFTHPPLRHIATLDVPQALVACTPEFAFTYNGRAPPAV